MENILGNLTLRYPSLQICKDSIMSAYKLLAKSFDSGRRLYICGNGGSAADSLHIVGELVKSYVIPRSIDKDFAEQADEEMLKNLQGALPAFALVENSALSTAYANDVNPDYVFAQQVYAYAREGDCVLGISTSGNSKNVINALKAAKWRGAVTVGLTGCDGGKMKGLCDACIIVPETETYKIQELHLPIYHALCIMLEQHFWGGRQ
ncbi:MAG TPA: SIS domain-containing protein [Desulfitobacterium dehalogenans]|uniref:SIS domain-containing protein n=1 Tax=Desulfitobacterium dehalogenans TaxID=36854 RepID=A0A7C6Z4L5_9FIRM|nr:SIS domain-containing protein [Desulfitobacterium dehalogenans]